MATDGKDLETGAPQPQQLSSSWQQELWLLGHPCYVHKSHWQRFVFLQSTLVGVSMLQLLWVITVRCPIHLNCTCRSQTL
jgi:hypothetical protein